MISSWLEQIDNNNLSGIESVVSDSDVSISYVVGGIIVNGEVDSLSLLAALDRKITSELAPKHDEKDGEDVKHTDTQSVEVIKNQTQPNDTKETMVAEPRCNYSNSVYMRFPRV